MSDRSNLLVVCGRNKRRSRTAESIFKNDMRFHIRSVGLSPKSNRQITERDVAWADLVLVMERPQKTRITEMYPHRELPRIEVLHIADEYEYLDSALVELLTDKINSTLKLTYDL